MFMYQNVVVFCVCLIILYIRLFVFKLLNNLRNTPQFDLNQAVDKELKEIITKKIEEMNTTTPEYQKLLNLSLNNPEKYLYNNFSKSPHFPKCDKPIIKIKHDYIPGPYSTECIIVIMDITDASIDDPTSVLYFTTNGKDPTEEESEKIVYKSPIFFRKADFYQFKCILTRYEHRPSDVKTCSLKFYNGSLTSYVHKPILHNRPEQSIKYTPWKSQKARLEDID